MLSSHSAHFMDSTELLHCSAQCDGNPHKHGFSMLLIWSVCLVKHDGQNCNGALSVIWGLLSFFLSFFFLGGGGRDTQGCRSSGKGTRSLIGLIMRTLLPTLLHPTTPHTHTHIHTPPTPKRQCVFPGGTSARVLWLTAGKSVKLIDWLSAIRHRVWGSLCGSVGAGLFPSVSEGSPEQN